MNELRIFSNPEFGKVRTTIVNGKEYFYGVDVAKALKYERPSKAVSDNCKGVLLEDTIKNDGGYSEKLITEGDMYRLIVKAATQSKSENVRKAADRFERWVFDVILPELRKTGSYSIQSKPDSYTIEDPAARARRWAEEYEERKALEEKVTVLEPVQTYVTVKGKETFRLLLSMEND